MTTRAILLAGTLLMFLSVAGCDIGIGNGHSCGPPHEGPCDVRDDKTFCVCVNPDLSEGPREACGDPGEHGGDTCTPATIETGTDVGCCAEATYPALRAQCLCRGNQPPSSCALIG